MSNRCPKCNGEGIVAGCIRNVNGTMKPDTEDCPDCDGTGRVPTKPLRERY